MNSQFFHLSPKTLVCPVEENGNINGLGGKENV